MKRIAYAVLSAWLFCGLAFLSPVASAAELEPTLVLSDSLPEAGEVGDDDSLMEISPYALQISPRSTMSTYVGTIPTNVYDYFRDITATLPWGSKYVFFRQDQYNYVLAYSNDLALNGSTFTSNSVSIVRYNSYSTQSNYGITRTTDNNFRVTAGQAFVYSNLGIYPRLFEGVTHYEFQALLVVTIISFLSSFVLRFFH